MLLVRGERRVGFEVKFADAPAITKSMIIALTDIGLSSLAILYPGQRRVILDRGIELVPLMAVDDFLSEQQLLPAVPQPASQARRRKR